MSNLIRRMLPVALLTVASAGALLTIPSAASADSPVTAGWWNEARQSNAAVGSLPDDPTYTDDGTLVIRNTPAGVAAFAGLRYVDREASGGTLTLEISDSKTLEAPVLVVCPTTSAWSGGGNQQWDHRPQVDCSKKISGQVNGSKITWTLSKAVETLPGTFDFVVIPDPGYTTPFEVTLAKPDDASFTPTGGGGGLDITVPPGTGSGSTGGDTGSFGAPATGSDVPSLPTDSSFSAPPAAGAVAPSVAGPEATAAPQTQGGAPVVAGNQTRPVATGSSDNDGRTLGIGLIVGLFLVLLILMANPGTAGGRRFSHPVLSSMGAGREPAPADGETAAAAPVALTRSGHPLLLQGAQEPRAGGVGRFVKARTRPPVRL